MKRWDGGRPTREVTVHECSKALPSAQDEFRSDCVEHASKQGNDGCGPSGPCPEPRPQQTAMEYFANAMAELLGCRNCYVAMISSSGLEEVRIGDVPADPSSTTMVERIARKGTVEDVASLEPINSRTSFVRKLIGAEPPIKGHSVIGRFASGERATVVFVAGWRPAALAAAEIPGLAHIVRPIWRAAHSLARQTPGHLDAQVWLEELTFPAIVADQGLHVYEVNRGGRVLLAKRELLRVDGGRLAGACGSVTESLRRAIRRVLVESGTHGLINTTVPLSTDRQQFAFAKIGAVPTHDELGRALIVVPQFDDVHGAHCIASAFGLNWAEERIVARILQFQCPRDIGAELRLTEATVRTYTKRIMLKLGINRQSEFFLLYHLTQSPFGAGRRESAVSRPASDYRLDENGPMRLRTAGKRSPD
ncbi:helix-turn-helix transcriptional regulator [Bradyrhizobium liaoningense]|nr:helix-turn-helix transcriptional regulator [Bradyrhizobium liaoningense]MBR0854827.1 helix-turn-helix transcriptional regulator [Bradyrhizobium liaoningense]